MRKTDIIRALRDEEYRSSLSETERAQLPSHPAGVVDLSDEQLTSLSGATLQSTCAHPAFCSTPAVSCVPPGTYCP